MDPTGGLGLPLLIVVVAIIACVWIFAPLAWALGVSVVLGGGFVALMLYVLSNARFT